MRLALCHARVSGHFSYLEYYIFGMKRIFLLVVILMAFSVDALATHVAVLETVADESSKEQVSFSDRQYLTNVLREQAVKELPAMQNYVIMTRENIQQMLPPGKAIEDCEGSCLVETGKNIAADYICQARVGSFGGALTLSAELYETAGNKLIASFNGRGADVNELLELIKQKSPDFFKVIREMSSPVPAPVPVAVEEKDTVPQQVAEPVAEPETDSVRTLANEAYANLDNDGWETESIPANVKDEPRSSGIHWVPLGISAAVTVTGAVLAVLGNNKAKTSSEKKYKTEAEYQKNHDDAKSGQTMRAVGIGLAIAGAVGIGLSFAF